MSTFHSIIQYPSFIHSFVSLFVLSFVHLLFYRLFIISCFFCLLFELSFVPSNNRLFIRSTYSSHLSFICSIYQLFLFFLSKVHQCVPSPVHSFVLSIFCSTYHLFILSIMHSFIRSTCHSFYLSFICFCLFFLSFVRSRYCLFILLFVLSISFIRYIYIYNGIYHNIVNFHFKKLYFQDNFL